MKCVLLHPPHKVSLAIFHLRPLCRPTVNSIQVTVPDDIMGDTQEKCQMAWPPPLGKRGGFSKVHFTHACVRGLYTLAIGGSKVEIP